MPLQERALTQVRYVHTTVKSGAAIDTDTIPDTTEMETSFSPPRRITGFAAGMRTTESASEHIMATKELHGQSMSTLPPRYLPVEPQITPLSYGT